MSAGLSRYSSTTFAWWASARKSTGMIVAATTWNASGSPTLSGVLAAAAILAAKVLRAGRDRLVEMAQSAHEGGRSRSADTPGVGRRMADDDG